MRTLFRLLSIVLVVAVVVALARRLLRAHGRLRGALYRLSGHHPDPNVDDRTLADRVRSVLGPIEKRLDLPRLHVMVEDHVVLLHGDVEWPHEEATITHAVQQVSGVRGVESHIHVGMLRSDTRPSTGRQHAAPRDWCRWSCQSMTADSYVRGALVRR